MTPDRPGTEPERFAFVVVANRLPVDRVERPDGQLAWHPARAAWSPPWSR